MLFVTLVEGKNMEPTKEALKENAFLCVQRYRRSSNFDRIRTESPKFSKALKATKAEDFEVVPYTKGDKKFAYLYPNEHPYYMYVTLTRGNKTKKILLGYLIRSELDKGYGDSYSCKVTYKPLKTPASFFRIIWKGIRKIFGIGGH